jgi:hypothetical protein
LAKKKYKILKTKGKRKRIKRVNLKSRKETRKRKRNKNIKFYLSIRIKDNLPISKRKLKRNIRSKGN